MTQALDRIIEAALVDIFRRKPSYRVVLYPSSGDSVAKYPSLDDSVALSSSSSPPHLNLTVLAQDIVRALPLKQLRTALKETE